MRSFEETKMTRSFPSHFSDMKNGAEIRVRFQKKHIYRGNEKRSRVFHLSYYVIIACVFTALLVFKAFRFHREGMY
jgi:hypothetical protein